MNPVVRHFWKNNREQVLSSSFLDCHVKGLHSIMLLNEPSKIVRLFVCTDDHMMWKNDLRGDRDGFRDPLSLGVHAHHCDLTLEAVRGCFYNITADPYGPATLEAFKYQSAILDGKCGFEKLNQHANFTLDWDCYDANLKGDRKDVTMPARQLHTVHVTRGEPAAWLVYEGAEDPDYKPITYSNWDLAGSQSDPGFYQKATAVEIQDLLESVDLI